jgi:hypothetical protein
MMAPDFASKMAAFEGPAKCLCFMDHGVGRGQRTRRTRTAPASQGPPGSNEMLKAPRG